MPLPRSLLTALAVACTPALADEPVTFDAIVVDAPTPDCNNMLVDNAPNDDCVVGLERAEICWWADPRVRLPRSAIHVGTRVRITRQYWVADRVLVIGLGEHEFTAVLEDWVAEHATCRGLPGPDLRLLETLGAPCYQLREQATASLRELGYGALRTLLWGRHAKDPEVRARAGTLLRELGWE